MKKSYFLKTTSFILMSLMIITFVTGCQNKPIIDIQATEDSSSDTSQTTTLESETGESTAPEGSDSSETQKPEGSGSDSSETQKPEGSDSSETQKPEGSDGSETQKPEDSDGNLDIPDTSNKEYGSEQIDTSYKMSFSNNVIFVSDNASAGGDGSSPSKPLYPTAKSADEINEKTSNNVKYGRYYKNTSLYQAIEKLATLGGGTIVLVGPTELNASNSYGYSGSTKDFELPQCTRNIRITSTYNGVDYSKAENGGAYLRIESPSNLILNAPTLFENLKIQTAGSNRTICANGNKIIMGNGIVCTAYENATATQPMQSNNGNNFPIIVGASRYGNFTGNTDITIKSGTYTHIVGSIYGVSSQTDITHSGNIKIDIQGGTFRNKIVAGAPNCASAVIDGDVDISISGGNSLSVGTAICLAGNGGFAKSGHTVTVTINDYRSYISGASLNKGFDTNTIPISADKYILNLSGATVAENRTDKDDPNNILHTLLSSAKKLGFTDIYYPAVWATDIALLKSPSTTYVLNGDIPSSKGASLNVSFTDPKDLSAYSQTVDYSTENTAFTATYGDIKNGKATAIFKYGNIQYATKSIDVLNAPKIFLDNANIIPNDSYIGLSFDAHFNDILDDRATIEEYGIIAVPEHLFPNTNALNFANTYGMNIIKSTNSDKLSLTKQDDQSSFKGILSSKIQLNQFNTAYNARAYIKLAYANNQAIYVYSDIITANPLLLAMEAVAAPNTEAETKTYLTENVIDKFANYSITTEYYDSTALRNKAVNAMRAQMNITWTPSESFWLLNNSDYTTNAPADLYFEKGKTYTGIPYTHDIFCQKENFSNFIVDGVLDISKIDGVVAVKKTSSPTQEEKDTAHASWLKFPGSDCSTSVITSWNTIINNRDSVNTLIATKEMIPGLNNGIIPIGDYSYAGYTDTTQIVTAQSSAIKKAYELLRPGDAIVHWAPGGGHVRMVSSNDPANKKLTTIECGNWSIPQAKVQGVLQDNNTNWKELTYTYDDLIADYYIPITIEELSTGCSESEYTLATDLDLETDLPNGQLSGIIKSNRQIISVDVAFKSATDGNTVTASFNPNDIGKWSMVHASVVMLEDIDLSSLNLEKGKDYQFSLSVKVAGLSASTPTVKLVQNYQFTAK